MKLLKQILPYIVSLILGILLLNECKRETKTETIIKTVKVPEIIKQHDTVVITKPTYIHSVDTVYVEKFVKSDSIGKIDLYKNSVTIREYNQVFQDSISKINVWSKTRGNLLEQSVNYTIFEREINDTITLPKAKRNFYFLPELGVNTQLSGFRAKGGFLYQDRKKHLYSLSIDTDGYVYVSVGIKF